MRSFSLLLLVGALLLPLPSSAQAQTVKPRFILLIDNSGSMSESAATRVRTHGDGSQYHPGCDLDGNGKYDDSKLFQAKAALNDTIAAFGPVEFALARYHANELGQPCSTAGECSALGKGANVCVDGHCAYSIGANSPDYNECSGGTANGNGCIRCADPDNDPTHVFYNGSGCCLFGSPTSGGFGMAGDVIVPFPAGGGSNQADLFMWMDGVETYPSGTNKELRAAATTPIGGSLNAVRDWLVNDASGAGSGSGILNRDAQIGCRSYNVILVTDGLEINACINNCGLNAARAAELLYHSCTHGGIWDSLDERCEVGGSPDGTQEVRVKTYVVGFAVNDPSLNAIAAAGGTGTALVANDQGELTARLGDIVASSIPREKCDCQDNTCDGLIDETFVTKGQACTVGVGRCKRTGHLACGADGTGVVCSADPPGMCPAGDLIPGGAVTEQCGVAPGCLAPTPEDCADDDCDGLTDENMSCSCVSIPETCNGLDDNCNGMVDDVASVTCGLSVGECHPGTTMCTGDGLGGKTTVCLGATNPTPETCDGKDNDCDGVADGFGVACYPGGAVGCTLTGAVTNCASGPASSWTCVGACQPGVLACAVGVCGACGGAVTPTTEVACDNIDNDCDGGTDEGFAIGTDCGPGVIGVGTCRPGTLLCVNNGLECVGGQGPVEEICNGKDDDCDGTADNIPGTCGSSFGECQAGRWVCDGAQAVCKQVVAPKPEICNGKDDDCDGTTDEDPTDPDLAKATPCGSSVGICRAGQLRCTGGLKSCEGGVLPQVERCNVLDDDCDGKADNDIPPPGPCPPPGLALGVPVVGECLPAANTCGPDGLGGAKFSCTGGVGPTKEVCDGKDNDCNGIIDNNAICPDNDNYGCWESECVKRCFDVSPVCPADRTCKNGLCILPECARKPCPRGFRCDVQRGCVDRCEGVTCSGGNYCEDGVCTNCHLAGCPAGAVCRATVCEPDPCLGVACGEDSYCRAGGCVKGCGGVKCPAAGVCRDGVCELDRCRSKLCAKGNGQGTAQYCDPTSGRCVDNPCQSITCLPGSVCVPVSGMCVLDPCLVTTCSGDDVCVVLVDGVAHCLTKKQVESTFLTRVSAGGAGCACEMGVPVERVPDGGAGAAVIVGGIFVWASARRKHRRRQR